MTYKGSWDRNKANAYEGSKLFCVACGFGRKSCKCEKVRSAGNVIQGKKEKS